MQNFFIRETPGKVMGLLGAALCSIAFLFSATISNASFSGMERVLPDPFAPENVVRAIDVAAARYSRAMEIFLEPARSAFAVHIDEMKWVLDEAAVPLTRALGLTAESRSQVAGAFTRGQKAVNFKVSGNSSAFSIDDIFDLLIGG